MATAAFDANLKGFRQVIGDYTRAYMFRITIPGWVSDAKTLSMFARSTNLPAYSIGKEEIGFQGQKIRVATVANFESPWSITVLADENQAIRGKLLNWASYIYDVGTMSPAAINQYKASNLKVEQLDRAGNSVFAYNFYGAWASKVGAPVLNHDTLAPQTFEVSFEYDFFTVGSAVNEIGADNSKPAIAPFTVGIGNSAAQPPVANPAPQDIGTT
jgi:hypothetical protein